MDYVVNGNMISGHAILTSLPERMILAKVILRRRPRVSEDGMKALLISALATLAAGMAWAEA